MEAELKALLDEHATTRDAERRRAVVRNGYLPRRQVLTGTGPVTVRVARRAVAHVRDRTPDREIRRPRAWRTKRPNTRNGA